MKLTLGLVTGGEISFDGVDERYLEIPDGEHGWVSFLYDEAGQTNKLKFNKQFVICVVRTYPDDTGSN